MTLEQEIRENFKAPTFKLSDVGLPEVCPYCGHSLELHPDSNVHIWCPNLACSRKLYGLLLKFTEKTGMSSLGKVSLQSLADSGSVKSIQDFLTLTPEVFKASIPRTGDKAYKAYTDSVRVLKSSPAKLPTLLSALNVPHCGEGVWEMILSAPVFASPSDLDTLQSLLSGSEADWVVALSSVPRLSERAIKISHKYRDFIRTNLEVLFSQGVSLKVSSTSGPLAGKKFCQTGGLTRTNPTTGKRMTRNDLIALIESNGGTWSDTIDKLTNLVIDDVNSTSSKAVKARKCGAALLSEADFFELLGC